MTTGSAFVPGSVIDAPESANRERRVSTDVNSRKFVGGDKNGAQGSNPWAETKKEGGHTASE